MKHKETANRLQQALSTNKMRAQDLSDRSGVAKASISQYINGTHKPSNVSAGKMAAILDVDPLWLMGFDVPMKKTTTIFEAAAGQGRICDAPTDTISMSLDDDQSYVTVHGSSMEPVLQDGDIVVVSATNIVRSQEEIMLVKINGDEATLKHVKYTNDGIYLIAENPAVYRAHFYSDKDIEELPVTIEGVVVKLIREL